MKNGLTTEHKKLIVEYMTELSMKSLIEDCEDLGEAYENDEIDYDDIENFIEDIKILLEDKIYY